jgi:hypothetical protein
VKLNCRNVLYVFLVFALAGCASTTVTNRQQFVAERLPRPQNIFVYDFAATPADVPRNSALAGEFDSMYQTPEQIATGRRLGAEIAAKLVDRISAMGLPAVRAYNVMKLRPNDIVIRGYLLSVNEGSASRRFVIGFGSGASELQVAVEGFQETPRGLRKLGSGTVTSKGGKLPGEATGLGVALATGNPIGLIVSTGAKLYGETSGRNTVEGRADQIANEIADRLKIRFEQQGWI